MTEAPFTSFERTFQLERQIGYYKGKTPGPIALFVAGMHGNEPSGILALKKVFERLDQLKPDFRGTVIGITGNLEALSQNKRFIDEDLNRNWNLYIDRLINDKSLQYAEDEQRKEMVNYLQQVVNDATREIFVFDLHSTSSESVPFVSINDTLRNRRLVRGIPVPVILGLEEQMDGTLLSILSELGISSLLFEAGQHTDWASVENQHAFIWLMLKRLKCIKPGDIPGFSRFYQILAKESPEHRRIFEVTYREQIDPVDNFKMKPEFVNFQRIEKGEHVAHTVGGPVEAPLAGRIFLPLYQELGDDGFFIVRQVNPTWLRISETLRNLQLDKMLGYLLGVKAHPEKEATMVINPKVALKALGLFHLLGYRKEKQTKGRLEVTRLKYDRKRPTPKQVLDNFNQLWLSNGQAPTAGIS